MTRAAASTKAFDSEFAFYGPVGFDIGQLWANLLMAAARSATLGDSDNLAWRLAQPVVAWEAFEQTLRAHWPRRVDAAVFTDRFSAGSSTGCVPTPSMRPRPKPPDA